MGVKVGITATQLGANESQLAQLRKVLQLFGATELHHGDCIGGDEQAHKIAKQLGLRVVIHPPKNPNKRAFCDGDEILGEEDYLKRNRNIVDQTDCLIAMPKGPEVLRSGTWSTVRYSRKKGKKRVIIYPS